MLFVLTNPFKLLLVFHLTGSNGESYMHNFFNVRKNMFTINFKKGEHNVHANAFVAVYKNVIRDQRISKTCPIFFF